MTRSIEVPSARMREHKPAHPERTAYRFVQAPVTSPRWGNVEIREWTNRPAMLKSLEMSEKGSQLGSSRWRAWPTTESKVQP